MAAGDVTSTNYGQYAISGAALATALDTINVSTVSGAIHIVPAPDTNQVTIIKTEIADT